MTRTGYDFEQIRDFLAHLTCILRAESSPRPGVVSEELATELAGYIKRYPGTPYLFSGPVPDPALWLRRLEAVRPLLEMALAGAEGGEVRQSKNCFGETP
jgi:hypothetical protein